VEPSAVRRLLKSIAETEEHEISCSECFATVSRYVELGSAALADASFAPLRQHLEQCGVCREEYEVLRALIQLDDDPPRPLT
jgi:hypothetical protein